VTILVNNYNYARFLKCAIDSALSQTYLNIEIVVVDDGSSDESREVIGSYGNQIKAVFKENGGQASAFNTGIRASRGDTICLLDSDDYFSPEKVERLLPHLKKGRLVYHRLRTDPGDSILPQSISTNGNFYAYAKKYRFLPFLGSPTSGIAIDRELAQRLLPLPTEHVRSSADDFLVRGAALVGEVYGIEEILATYRIHGSNAWYGTDLLKPPEFMEALEQYLNRKLLENDKEGAIDFYRSMYARSYIPQTRAALSSLAMAVFMHHRDLTTTRFLLRTLWKAYGQITSKAKLE
jgi:glycosyltransferase involved in cell wall biosynthesis